MKKGQEWTKETRLKRKSTAQQQRLAAQNPDERATRLQQMSISQQQRLATETHEEKTVRLQHVSALQQQRLATETREEKTVRLQHVSVEHTLLFLQCGIVLSMTLRKAMQNCISMVTDT